MVTIDISLLDTFPNMVVLICEELAVNSYVTKLAAARRANGTLSSAALIMFVRRISGLSLSTFIGLRP